MANGQVSISRLVKGSINLGAVAAQQQDLNTLLVLGSTAVIDPETRIREYQDATAVAQDFGTTSPEYYSAAAYFGQQPSPSTIRIGRWVRTASKAQLVGATLPAAQQAMALWNAVATPRFAVTVNGTANPTVSVGSFAGAANLHGVAGIIQSALATIVPGSTAVWNASYQRFEFTVGTTGTSSTITFLSAPGSGTDISTMLGMTSGTSGAYIVNGRAAESVIDAVTDIELKQGRAWYGLFIPEANAAEQISVANFIEATDTRHLFAVNTQEAGVLNPTTTDIAAQLQGLGLSKTFVHYSSASQYAAASDMGKALSVDYTGSNTTLTMMYKTLPGITAETINSTQVSNVLSKNANLYVKFNNNVSILMEGKVASGDYIDTITGADALCVEIQNAIFNLLYTAKTKVPQTEGGVHQLVAEAERVLARYVINGWIAPGTWTEQGFGTLKMGAFLERGFYIYTAPLALQSSADRAARKAPLMQIAVKLAGAIHYANFLINVNR